MQKLPSIVFEVERLGPAMFAVIAARRWEGGECPGIMLLVDADGWSEFGARRCRWSSEGESGWEVDARERLHALEHAIAKRLGRGWLNKWRDHAFRYQRAIIETEHFARRAGDAGRAEGVGPA